MQFGGAKISVNEQGMPFVLMHDRARKIQAYERLSFTSLGACDQQSAKGFLFTQAIQARAQNAELFGASVERLLIEQNKGILVELPGRPCAALSHRI